MGFQEGRGGIEFSRGAAEDLEQRVYDGYLEDMGISEEDIAGRDIVDIGAGSRMFAGHCAMKGLDARVFSVEPEAGSADPEQEKAASMLWTSEVKDKVSRRTMSAVRSSVPLDGESMDMVLVRGAMPGTEQFYDRHGAEAMNEDIDKAFSEICRIMRPGGEARMYPFYGSDYDNHRKPWKEAIDAKLAEISDSDEYQVEVQELDGGSSKETEARIVIRKSGK